MSKFVPYLRVFGDVGGLDHAALYLAKAKQVPFSLQLGDLSGSTYVFLDELNPVCHKAIAGNHEVFDKSQRQYFRNIPHFLGDYGVWTIPNFSEIFYVRGAFSINKKMKESLCCWSEEEECSVQDLENAIALYDSLRPDFVVSHACPYSLVKYVADPLIAHRQGFSTSFIKTKTNQALDVMFEIHQPKIWLFAHYHTYFYRRIGKTCFICLNELPNREFFVDFPQGFLAPKDYIDAEYVDAEDTEEYMKYFKDKDEDLKDHLNPDNPFELELGGMG